MTINTYLNDKHYAILEQAPAVIEIQRGLMVGWGFVPVKRDGNQVMWELHMWPELNFWLPAQQADLGLTYIIAVSYMAGIRDGRAREVDTERLRAGLPIEIREDQNRLGTFLHIWTQINALRTPADMAGS